MPISDYIKKYFEASPDGVRIRDVLREVPGGIKKTSQKILGGFQSAGQSSFRGFAALGGAVTGQTLTPSTSFQKQLYGTDKPITLRSFGAELGLKEEGKLAPVAGFGLAAADLIPGGKVTKAGAVTLLKNANKADDALRILNKTMGIAREVAEKYLDDAVRLTDEKQLASLVDKVVNESQQVSRFVEKGKKLFTGTKVADSLQPLAQEAQKYKSAEEFVRSQKLLYHGTSKESAEAIKMAGGFNKETARISKTLTGSEVSPQSPISLTLDKKTGELYVGSRPLGEEGVLVAFQSRELKLVSEAEIKNMGLDKLRFSDHKKFIEELRKKGFDGYHTSSPHDELVETIVFNKEKLKLTSESQLTDFYNRVKGGIGTTKQERGFITSAKEIIPEADRIAGQYIPRGTDELAIKAKNLIASNFATAERMALTGSDDNAVAIASELLKKYADDAAKATDPAKVASLYDKAAEVANTLAPKLTEQGRSIQAASILGRLTPEGQVRF